ncbi:hypothetical protein acdb102_25220 [Acidothermaceae bacterium B102]|nr:hypothetical protein acdb102_25220 [Acidothermaceae bacterium B102]
MRRAPVVTLAGAVVAAAVLATALAVTPPAAAPLATADAAAEVAAAAAADVAAAALLAGVALLLEPELQPVATRAVTAARAGRARVRRRVDMVLMVVLNYFRHISRRSSCSVLAVTGSRLGLVRPICSRS